MNVAPNKASAARCGISGSKKMARGAVTDEDMHDANTALQIEAPTSLRRRNVPCRQYSTAGTRNRQVAMLNDHATPSTPHCRPMK